MVKHYFQTPNPDLASIQKRLAFWFKQHEYEVDSADDDGVYLIQARKTGKLRTLTGTNIAFKIRLYPSDSSNEFVFESATGQWTQNIAGASVTALFTGGITLLTGAAGAAWAMKVERDIVEFMEHSLQFKKTKSVDDKGNVGTTLSPPSPPRSSAPPPLPDAPPPAVATEAIQSPRQRAVTRAKDDLKKLEAAHTAGILDDTEFQAKKSALRAKVDEYEVQFVVEEKAVKLKAALADDIIDQAAYDAKYASLAQIATDAIQKERKERAKAEQLSKLKACSKTTFFRKRSTMQRSPDWDRMKRPKALGFIG